MAKYLLRFWFDWSALCLWPANEEARKVFECGIEDYEILGLSSELCVRIREMSEWHDQSLNWGYPPDPGPWREAECDRFNKASRELCGNIVKELGPEFEVIYDQDELHEDPDLDRYLADPQGFRRMKANEDNV